MRKIVLVAVLAMAASGAQAKVIERACLKSDRQAASRALCSCIQTVANRTLSGSEQRRGAKFFSDPHLAQEIRQSDRRTHEEFWQRWRNFGATAEAYCRR